MGKREAGEKDGRTRSNVQDRGCHRRAILQNLHKFQRQGTTDASYLRSFVNINFRGMKAESARWIGVVGRWKIRGGKFVSKLWEVRRVM